MPQPGPCCRQPEGSFPPTEGGNRRVTAAVPAAPGRAVRERSPGGAGLEGDIRKAMAEPGDDPVNFCIWVGF